MGKGGGFVLILWSTYGTEGDKDGDLHGREEKGMSRG